MTDAKTLARARHLVEDSLSEKRCSHVFAVTEEMRELVRAFELFDVENELLLAALLHDITKEKTTDAQLQLCAEYGIILSAEDRAVSKGLHAITGAAFAAREFSLDAPFSDALRWHTTGRANMTLYDKLLFLADYIEKTRTWGPCRVLRRLFWKQMKTAKTREEKEAVLTHVVRVGLDSTLQDLLEEERFIHPDTVAARNDLLFCETNH